MKFFRQRRLHASFAYGKFCSGGSFAGLDIRVRVKSRFSLYKLMGRVYLSQTHTTCSTELQKTYCMNAS